MIYIFYELAKNQRIQQKLRKEIVASLEGETPLSFDSLVDLPYLNQVFYEALRLHPPTPFTSRICSEDIEIETVRNHKVTVKKDSLVWIPVYSIQRDSGKLSITEFLNDCNS